VIGAIFLITLPREQTCADHDGERHCRNVRDFAFVARAEFLCGKAALILNSLGLAMNFGLANTIVQERSDYLRARVSAVFMLSFVG